MDTNKALGAAWDRGFDTAARQYWHKPRNPFTGEMNDDDPEDYCPSHGGTAPVGYPDCESNPLPYKDGQPQPCPGHVPTVAESAPKEGR